MRKYNIVGVMSGTSMDGLDIAHVTLEEVSEGKWSHSINAAYDINLHVCNTNMPRSVMNQ